MADTGLDTAIFYVWDNGTPALSDTDAVYIVISPNPVNRAPVWVSRKVRESVQVGEVFLYDLNNRCYDLDGEKLTFSLRAEPPVNDTIKGSAYTLPTPPQRDGYTFAGWWWTNSSDVSTQFITGTSVTSNMTVIAKWNPILYSVKFLSPDATDGNLVQTVSVTYNSTIATLPTSTRTNCKFTGWWLTQASTYPLQFTSQFRVTKDTTVEASWCVVDIEGNEYKVRKYGTQTWMVENFRSQHYNDDNSQIPMFTTAADWTGATSGRASIPRDNATQNEIVTAGLLYNWYAVNSLRLAPTGWHVPTVQEFRTLLTTMKPNGYSSPEDCESTSDTVYCVARAIASNQYCWGLCNNGAGPYAPGYDYTTNNSSKFNIYPSGYLDQTGSLGSWRYYYISMIWCSDVISPTTYGRVLQTNGCSVQTSFRDYSKNQGFSVRFVKDSN